MTCEIVQWESTEQSLGRAVVAIGVFDGVHLGHQALVADTVALAAKHKARPVVITFDRDPDRVVTPDSAAPQLLTLDEKLTFLEETGADAIVVVRFCRKLAELTPHRFVTDVLLDACEPVAVVVGTDFRFGRSAAGNVDTMHALGSQWGFEVVPQPLLEVEGGPVTSTRIRGLVAAGDVAGAARLLGRPHRIHGPVVHGRGAGAGFGFPTANVMPQPHAALPAAGVYAGRVIVRGEPWPAAISVGKPPMFPEATDTLEAHVIGFEGDLYRLEVTVEFLERLRDQKRYDSHDELSVAIARDVEMATAIATESVDGDEFEINPFTAIAHKVGERLSTDDPRYSFEGARTQFVDDPDALDAAEREAAGVDPLAVYDQVDEGWVELVGPAQLSGILDVAGFTAALATASLDAAEIPHAWDPYPPELMPSFRIAYGAVDRPFRLLVPASRLEEAQAALAEAKRGYSVAPPPQPQDEGSSEQETPESPRGQFWPARHVLVTLVLLAFAFNWLATSLTNCGYALQSR